MIVLSNGHKLEYVVASGALGVDGKGWFWERPLVWLGLIKPELFTIILKSLTLKPTKGNLCWWKPWTWLPFSPWSCVRLIKGGAVNKVGLTNPGIHAWLRDIAFTLNFKQPFVVSLFGTKSELLEMAKLLNLLQIVAIEINVSCPNADHTDEAAEIIDCVKAVKRVSRHPILLKLSVTQDYLTIIAGVKGCVEAIDLNSIPWAYRYPYSKKSPLSLLEKKVGGGGGGVSGIPAQGKNWNAVEEITKQGLIPVIAPSIMGYEDLDYVRGLGALAVSFGTIHLPAAWKPWTLFTNPCKPTWIVKRDAQALNDKANNI